VDVLVQLAVLHAEFEALHPFEDGNGRLGRILIPLFLFQRKLLASPDFYMSSYLESNREVYVEKLRGISRDNDWTGWIMFFLEGIRRQSFSNESKAKSILLLYDRLKMELVENMRSQYSIRALGFLFQTPVFTSTTFVKQSGIPKPTTTRLLGLLRELSVLTPIRMGRGRRAGIFAFRELVNLAEGKEIL
jgi:Fic family protein